MKNKRKSVIVEPLIGPGASALANFLTNARSAQITDKSGKERILDRVIISDDGVFGVFKRKVK